MPGCKYLLLPDSITWVANLSRFNPIIKPEFISTLLNPTYRTNLPNVDHLHSHQISVLFIVLACGLFHDEDDPGSVFLAEQYQALARAALSLDPILNDPTCAAIQALLVMASFIHIYDRTANEFRWFLSSLANRIVQMVSLIHNHRYNDSCI